jgi:hypothetical protein
MVVEKTWRDANGGSLYAVLRICSTEILCQCLRWNARPGGSFGSMTSTACPVTSNMGRPVAKVFLDAYSVSATRNLHTRS